MHEIAFLHVFNIQINLKRHTMIVIFFKYFTVQSYSNHSHLLEHIARKRKILLSIHPTIQHCRDGTVPTLAFRQ